MGANSSASGANDVAFESDETAVSSPSLTPIWIGVAIALLVALVFGWSTYRSTVEYAITFDSMTHTEAVLKALDAARGNRTLLANSYRKYQLENDRESLESLAPLTAKITGDASNVYGLIRDNPVQRQLIDSVTGHLSELARLNAGIAKQSPASQSLAAARLSQFAAADVLLEKLRIELAEMSAEQFRQLSASASEARSRAYQGQLVGALGCVIIVAWLFALVGWGARMVRRLDHKARQVIAGEHALRQVNSALEMRVQSRTAALTEQHNLLESILDAMSEAVVAVNVVGELRITNSAAEQILSSNLTNENLLAGFESVDAGRATPMTAANSPLMRVIVGEKVSDLILSKHDARTDEMRWFESSFRPVAGSLGSPGGAVMVLRDVTERQLAREELQRAHDEALEEVRRRTAFVSRTGHQVRTPLSAIIGRADLLLLTDVQGEQRRHIEIIKSSAELLTTIVNDVYDYSMLSTGKLPLQKNDFELVAIVEEVVETFVRETKSRGIEIGLFIDSGLPIRLRGDPHRFRQILYNSILNAMQATETRQVQVVLSKLDENASSITINFQIKDTGRGLPSELRERLFEPYGNREDGAGTGLELAIASQLIHRMNGEVGIESDIGKGSNLHFSLRLEKAAEERIGAHFDFVNSPLKGAGVLLVGAPSLQRESAAGYLAAWGLVPSIVESGALALERLRAADNAAPRYWGALIDSHVSGQSGAQIAEAIKSAPELRTTKVIVASADPGREHSAAVDGWLRKPLMPTMLADLIRRLESPLSSLSSLGRSAGAAIADPSKARVMRASVRILVVEDDTVTRAIMAEQLSALGFNFDVASDAAQALEIFERRQYDLVLMDIGMPGMNGIEAAREIRRREGDARHTTIIAHTAYTDEPIRHQARKAGMDDYLAKPVSFGELRQVLDAWMLQLPSSREAPLESDDRLTAQPPQELDQARLGEIEELSKAAGRNILAKLVQTFLSDLPNRLASLESAIEREDFKAFAAEVHALRGSSGEIGAKHFASLCENAEDLARSGSPAAKTSALSLIRYARSLPEVLKRASSAIV